MTNQKGLHHIMLPPETKTPHLPRTLEKVLAKAYERFKGVSVTGMHRVGKRTLLRTVLPETEPVNLERFGVWNPARETPEDFFRRHPLPLRIENAQKAPELALELKALLDDSDERGWVQLTESERMELRRSVPEALSGRVARYELLPLSLSERHGKGPEQKPFLPPENLPTPSVRPISAEELWRTAW